MTRYKAQVSIESMTLIGFILLFSIPLLFLVTTLNTQDVNIEQARMSARIMGDAANSVYTQGPSSQKIVSVAYPSSLKNITLLDREIIFVIETSYGNMEIIERTFAPINTADSELIGDATHTSSSGQDFMINAGLRKIRVYYSDDPTKGIIFEMIE